MKIIPGKMRWFLLIGILIIQTSLVLSAAKNDSDLPSSLAVKMFRSSEEVIKEHLKKIEGKKLKEIRNIGVVFPVLRGHKIFHTMALLIAIFICSQIFPFVRKLFKKDSPPKFGSIFHSPYAKMILFTIFIYLLTKLCLTAVTTLDVLKNIHVNRTHDEQVIREIKATAAEMARDTKTNAVFAGTQGRIHYFTQFFDMLRQRENMYKMLKIYKTYENERWHNETDFYLKLYTDFHDSLEKHAEQLAKHNFDRQLKEIYKEIFQHFEVFDLSLHLPKMKYVKDTATYVIYGSIYFLLLSTIFLLVILIVGQKKFQRSGYQEVISQCLHTVEMVFVSLCIFFLVTFFVYFTHTFTNLFISRMIFHPQNAFFDAYNYTVFRPNVKPSTYEFNTINEDGMYEGMRVGTTMKFCALGIDGFSLHGLRKIPGTTWSKKPIEDRFEKVEPIFEEMLFSRLDINIGDMKHRHLNEGEIFKIERDQAKTGNGTLTSIVRKNAQHYFTKYNLDELALENGFDEIEVGRVKSLPCKKLLEINEMIPRKIREYYSDSDPMEVLSLQLAFFFYVISIVFAVTRLMIKTPETFDYWSREEFFKKNPADRRLYWYNM